MPAPPASLPAALSGRCGTPRAQVQRAALVNLGELAMYDTSKQWALESGLFSGAGDVRMHGFCAALSGFSATVASTPADVVKTRLMSQSASAPQYRGSSPSASTRRPRSAVAPRCSAPATLSARLSGPGFVDCVVQLVRQEGVGVLYRGFWPTWARLGPWQMTFWLSYERARSPDSAQTVSRPAIWPPAPPCLL